MSIAVGNIPAVGWGLDSLPNSPVVVLVLAVGRGFDSIQGLEKEVADWSLTFPFQGLALKSLELLEMRLPI